MQAALRTADSSSSSSFTSTSTATSKTRAGTTSLIYLPPFCYPCKHVPAAGARIQSRSRSQGQTLRYNGSCCSACPPGWEHKNYDKHASAATLTPAATAATTTGPAAATMSSSCSSSLWTGKFLQASIQLPAAAAGHRCTDLRQTSQLVMPTMLAAGGDVGGVAGGVLECGGKRCWRRERMRRERPSHASAPAPLLAQVNPISTSPATMEAALGVVATHNPGGAVTTAQQQHNSQTTTTATARGTTGAALPHDEEEYDECRCFNYNGDISLERCRGEAAQLSGITWLMFLWQQLLPGNGNKTRSHSSNGSSSSSIFPAATTRSRSSSSTTTTMTSTKSWLGPLLMLLLATSVSGWGGRQDGE